MQLKEKQDQNWSCFFAEKDYSAAASSFAFSSVCSACG